MRWASSNSEFLFNSSCPRMAEVLAGESSPTLWPLPRLEMSSSQATNVRGRAYTASFMTLTIPRSMRDVRVCARNSRDAIIAVTMSALSSCAGPFTSTHTSTLRNNLVCGHAVQRHIVRQTYARLALPFVVCWHSVQENTSLSPVHSFLALPYATLSRRS